MIILSFIFGLFFGGTLVAILAGGSSCPPPASGQIPGIASLAVELARRLPELQADSVENNAHLIANLLRQHIS
jgi:hypothetical protein